MGNIRFEDIKTTWRNNDAPQNYKYMLCHNFTSDVFFVMPRCSVCSEFYIPTTWEYISKFIKFNDYNVNLPSEIDKIFIIGQGTKQLAGRLKRNFDYMIYNYKNFYKINDKGYDLFKQFIKSLGVE